MVSSLFSLNAEEKPFNYATVEYPFTLNKGNDLLKTINVDLSMNFECVFLDDKSTQLRFEPCYEIL